MALSVLKRIEFRDDRHIYHQIVHDIRELIRKRRLVPGERIPSETDMAKVYGVARGTIRQAREVLKREGWIVIKRGRGAFVADHPPDQLIN